MSGRSLNTLQAGRAFAALVVLLFHTNIVLRLDRYIGTDIFPVFNSGNSGVHYFFVLSGFVILLAHEKDIGRSGRAPGFLWKRVRRIYPPLWGVLLILLGLYAWVPALRQNGGPDPWTVLSAFAVTPAEQDRLMAVEWTLRHEMLFYVAFALILWRPRIGLAVAAICLALSAILPWTGPAYPLSFFFSSYHLLFGFGALTYLAFSRQWVRLSGPTLALGLAIFAATWTSRLLAQPPEDLTNIAYGLGAALIILGAANLERDQRLEVPRLLVFLGEASYSIYLVHFVAVSAAAKAVTRLDSLVTAPPEIWFLLTASAALIAGVLFHLAVERPVLNWLSGFPRRPSAAMA